LGRKFTAPSTGQKLNLNTVLLADEALNGKKHSVSVKM
jgi:hypothetical protein